MKVSAIERAHAALREEVHHQWRDWVRYLRAHQTLAQGRAAERQLVLERNPELEAQVAGAQRTLAVLPPARRALFDEVREARRQQTQATREAEQRDGQLIDPDQIEVAVLQTLLDEALGTNDAEGYGVVPMRDGSELSFYDVHARSLQEAPTAASYALGDEETGNLRTRLILAGLLVVGGLLFFVVWFLWPFGGERTVDAAAPVAAANGQALTPWPITAIVVDQDGQEPVQLPVVSAGPVTPDDSAAAIWFAQHLVPLRLCLPADVLSRAHRVVLVSGDGRPDRVFTFGEASQPGDLVLEPCRGGGTARTAVLQQVAALPDTSVGTTLTLADAQAATLVALEIIGPGDDPTLPSGQARVTARVRASISDWAPYAPTLLLASGEALSPAEAPIREGDETLLTYLIPLPTATLPVQWSLTPPGTGQPARWRFSLPVPPLRTAVVREALAVRDVTTATNDSGLAITVTLHNRHALPFQLTPDDLNLAASNGSGTLPLVVPNPAALTPLAPGATRTLTLSAPLPTNGTDALILSIGATRFALTQER